VQYFEGFICAKDPFKPDTCEDQIVVQPGALYAVIDGATDISGKRFSDSLGDDATGGRLAAVAMANTFRRLGCARFETLPEPDRVLSLLTDAVWALYERLGIADDVLSSGDHRFRAAFAAAFMAGETVRVMRVGDCSVRINGSQILKHDFPADIVLSAARSLAWGILSDRGVPADVVRAGVRQLIVKGLDADNLETVTGLTSVEIAEIRRNVTHLPAIITAAGGDRANVEHILSSGLEGVRAAPQDFDALVVDGVSDVTGSLSVVDIPIMDMRTLELFSDGYPAAPDEASVAAWEAALREADETDPERIGAYASTKGRVGNNFGDDRSIIIAKATLGQSHDGLSI